MADRLTDNARGASIAAIWESVDAATQRRIAAAHDAAHIDFAVRGAARLRTAQRAPEGDWTIWAILAGRGFGKTRAGAEWVHELAAQPGRRIALVAASLEAARQVMVEGESGLLARVPAGGDVRFVPSLRQVNWANGSQARLFSGGEPDSLRGSQFDFAWGDEFAHWPRAEEALMNLRLATRLPGISTASAPIRWRWKARAPW